MWTVGPDEWWRTQEVNLRGAHTAVRAVVPGMVEAGHGRVVTGAADHLAGRYVTVADVAPGEAGNVSTGASRR